MSIDIEAIKRGVACTQKLQAIAKAAKRVWDSDEFFEDERGRTDEVDTTAILALGDLLEEFEAEHGNL